MEGVIQAARTGPDSKKPIPIGMCLMVKSAGANMTNKIVERYDEMNVK
jgi:hypothetical protein